MNFFISMVGVILGILISIGIIFLIIYWKVKSIVGPSNINSLKSAIANAKTIEKQEYNREKNVSGMTTLMEPQILRDFPDFNKELIFSTCENNLRKIFNVLESKNEKDIINDQDFIYLKDKIIEQIKDMKSNNIIEKFDNIEFNRHAISAYNKRNGKATIKISSSVSYYYQTNRKDKKSFPDIKKQTRYTSEFVYVYDENNFGDNQVSFSVNCPNCGAPLKSIKSNYCEYCGSYIEKINLKVWQMSSYKEDYK